MNKFNLLRLLVKAIFFVIIVMGIYYMSRYDLNTIVQKENITPVEDTSHLSGKKFVIRETRFVQSTYCVIYNSSSKDTIINYYATYTNGEVEEITKEESQQWKKGDTIDICNTYYIKHKK